MSWLRIDDGFPEHPKLVKLGKSADRWTWLELLAYCARRETGGTIPRGVDDVLRRVTPKFLERCVTVGLVDREDDGDLTVHDWNIYNGTTLQDRVFAFLEKFPDATANEVQRETRGNRQAVLGLFAEFHRFRNGSVAVPPVVPKVVPAPAPAPALDVKAEVLLETTREEPADKSAKKAKPSEREHHPYDPPADPGAAIATLIRNGAITDLIDLDAELAGLHVNGTEADVIRERWFPATPIPALESQCVGTVTSPIDDDIPF